MPPRLLQRLSWLPLILLVVAAPFAQAATFPRYALSVSFDAAHSMLIGEAVIDPTPGQATRIDLGDLVVRRLTVAGRELPVHAAQHALSVDLPGPIRIDYTAAFKDGDDNRVSADTVLLQGVWYPYVEGMHRYRLQATLPEGFEAVSESETVTRTKIPGGLRFEFDYPHPLAAADGITLVASSRFAVRQIRQGAVAIVTYLRPEHADRAAVFLAAAQRYLRRFEAQLGPYPFKRLAIVEAPRGFDDSVSMPTYILLAPSEFDIDDITETALGHEIAHQWFGNLAYIDYDRGNWAEGLAIYFADHGDAQAAGKGWMCRKRMIEGNANNVDAAHAMPLAAFSERQGRPSKFIGYGKSAMIFHMLRLQVGDAAFFRSLRAFLRPNRFRVAGWDALQGAFEGETRQRLDWFFEQWVARDDVPELRLEGMRAKRSGAGYTLDFSVSQSGKPFRLVLPVTYRFAGGERKARLNLARQDQAYRVALPGRPREIVLDADYEVFRRPSVPEITPTLDRLLTRPNVVVVAPAAQAERFAALPDILAAGEAALDLQWRPGPLKRRPGAAVPDRHWRDAFEPHRAAAGNVEMRDASLILLGRDNPRIGRLFGDLPRPDADFA
ncbi:MAG: M1 family metallopeptidase, partial [Pigmentiphaga sp.]